MLLGSRNLTMGDVRRYEIDYTPFLTAAGATGHLINPIAVVAPSIPPATSQVISLSMNSAETQLYIYVKGGTVLGEQFTVNVTVQDSQGETVNDTLAFTLVSP